MNNSKSFHTWPCTIKRHSLDWFCSKQYRTTQRSIKLKKMFGGGRVEQGRGIVGTRKRTGWTRDRTRWTRERNSWTRTVWFGSATQSDIKRLQQTVRTAERNICAPLPNLQYFYISRVRKRAKKITLDPTHPAHSLFELLPSGQRYQPPGPCRDLWRGRCSKYKRGTWNTAFNRAVILADMCFEMDASVLIQQQMP